MNIRCRHTDRAFTLIEILIAMAILGAIVTAIYASWTAILRGAKVGLDAAADVQRTRIAMRTVEEALSSAVMFSKNAYFYGFESDTSGNFAMLSFVSRLPDSFPGGGMFPGQPLRRVTFGVEPDAGGVNQLVMRQMPVFQVLEAGEQPYPIVLSRKVSQFGLEFWDSKLNDWTYEWVQTNQLPPLVRVSLGFGEAKKNLVRAEDLAIREIALASVAVAPEHQVGQAVGGASNTNQLRQTNINPPPKRPKK